MGFFVYTLTCTVTGQTYVGKTTRSNPALRWSEHLVELRNNISKHPQLQACWNQYPSLRHWLFQVLVDGPQGELTLSELEARAIIAVPPELRLNAALPAVILIEKYDAAIRMLREGSRYIDIRDAVGISLGTISKLKRENQLQPMKTT